MKPKPMLRRSGRGAHRLQKSLFRSLNISTSSGESRQSRALLIPLPAGRTSGSSGPELPDRLGDRPGVRLEREMAGVEEADVGFRDVAAIRLGSGGQEERVVPAPDG